MEQSIKIIALDMDGVINSNELIQKWINEHEKKYGREKSIKIFREEFCNCEELVFPELAEKITKIVNETDCYILWTSTWRKLERYKDIEDAKDMFNRRGLPGDKLVAYTPQIGMSWGGHCRGSEIAAWIRDNTEYNIMKCAVIDDRIDAGENLPKNAKYFNINANTGITTNIVKKIIQYLNKE